MSRRRRDHLVGAGVTLLVLLVLSLAAVTAVALWISDPVEDVPSAAGRPAPMDPDPTPPEDLGEGETWLGDVVLESGTLLTSDTRLVDVRAVGSDLRFGTDGTTAGQLQVEATVPFDVVAAELGQGTLVGAAEDGEASVEREAVLAGRVFRVVATGTVEVVDGRLVVEPRTIDVGGPDFLSRTIAGVARELVTIEHTVQGLPEGLVLQEVTVGEDGFRAELSGEDVVLGTAEVP